MATIFTDNFDTYTHGSGINGQGGWVSNGWSVLNPPGSIKGVHVVGSAARYASNNITSNIEFIQLSIETTFTYGDKIFIKSVIKNADGNTIAGFYESIIFNGTAWFALYVEGGTSNQVQISNNKNVPTTIIMTINRATKKYTSCIINGTDRIATGDLGTNLNLPVTNQTIKKFYLSLQSSVGWGDCGCKCGYVDIAGWGRDLKMKKYTKFPRWQKTKYGLRPFY